MSMYQLLRYFHLDNYIIQLSIVQHSVLDYLFIYESYGLSSQ